MFPEYLASGCMLLVLFFSFTSAVRRQTVVALAIGRASRTVLPVERTVHDTNMFRGGVRIRYVPVGTV